MSIFLKADDSLGIKVEGNVLTITISDKAHTFAEFKDVSIHENDIIVETEKGNIIIQCDCSQTIHDFIEMYSETP